MSRLGSCQTEYEASARNSVYGEDSIETRVREQGIKLTDDGNLQDA